MAVGVGIWEMLIVLLGAGGGLGSGLLGTPPGVRDTALQHAAPADAAVYLEWSERGTAKLNEPGFDALLSEPEVRQFLSDVRRAILEGIEADAQRGGPEEQLLGRNIPYLVETMTGRPGSISVRIETENDPEAGPQPGAGLNGVLGFVPKMHATVIVNGGEAADEIEKRIKEILELPPLSRDKNEKLEHVALPSMMPTWPIVLHRHDDYFILGLGEGTVDAAVKGLDAASGGLGDSERFQQAIARVAFERQSMVTWVDIVGIRQSVAELLGPQGAMIDGVARMVGLGTVDSLVSATGVEGGQMTSRSLLATGGETGGILSLAAGRGIDADDLQHVPADADLVFAVSLSPAKILASAKQIAAQVDPNTEQLIERQIEALEGELELQIEEEVLAAFGDVWVIHDSPAAGGLLVTSAVASLQVEDAEKARKVYDRLVEIMQATIPGEFGGNGRRRRGVFLEKREFLGSTVYYINTVGDDDVPVAPCFCLTRNHLYVTLHPQAMKSQLRALQGDGKHFGERLAEFDIPEGDVLQLSYIKSSELIPHVYAFLPYVGQIIMSEVQSEGVGIDIYSLPSAAAVLPHLRDSFGVTVRTEQGILMQGKSAIPLPVGGVTSLLPFFLMTVGIRSVGAVDVGVDAIEVEEAVPVNAVDPVAEPANVARPKGKLDAERRNARQVVARAIVN